MRFALRLKIAITRTLNSIYKFVLYFMHVFSFVLVLVFDDW